MTMMKRYLELYVEHDHSRGVDLGFTTLPLKTFYLTFLSLILYISSMRIMVLITIGFYGN